MTFDNMDFLVFVSPTILYQVYPVGVCLLIMKLNYVFDRPT